MHHAVRPAKLGRKKEKQNRMGFLHAHFNDFWKIVNLDQILKKKMIWQFSTRARMQSLVIVKFQETFYFLDKSNK